METNDTPIPTSPTGDDLVAMEQWFDRLEDARVHPRAIGPEMRRNGHPDQVIAWAERRYRNRFPTHPAIWWGGLCAIGFSVLASAGVVHSLIDGARETAAEWFGIMLVSLVFAAVALWLIRGISGRWSQQFSSSRRAAATTLFWAAIAVAVIRGMVYGQVLGHAVLVGDQCETTYSYGEDAYGDWDERETTTCEDRTVDALAQLGLTASAAAPVALWAWFCHRRPTDAPELPALVEEPVSGGAA